MRTRLLRTKWVEDAGYYEASGNGMILHGSTDKPQSKPTSQPGRCFDEGKECSARDVRRTGIKTNQCCIYRHRTVMLSKALET